jgi:hypothetical protein
MPVQRSQSLSLLSLCVIGCLITTLGAATAHHSLSEFDIVGPVEIEGTVQEFKYTSPHSYILLKVKGADGRIATWTLEGVAGSTLGREGWTSKNLKPGDQIRATIAPLLNGGAGGSWNPQGIRFRDGNTVTAGR